MAKEVFVVCRLDYKGWGMVLTNAGRVAECWG